MRPPAPVRTGCLAVLLAATALASQLRAAQAATWEEVPREQLALARSSIEPGAGAEAIFWKVWVDDATSSTGLRQVRNHYVRIKIFTEQAAQDYSKIDIDYPLLDASVDDVDARTTQPDGTIVPLDRKTVVKVTVAKKKGVEIRRRSFAPPALRPGCVVEYRYREERFGEKASAFDLQLDIPVEKLAYFVRPLKLRGWTLRQMRFHSTAVASKGAVNGYFETTAENLPAYKPEPFDPPEYQQRPWLLDYYTTEELTSADEFWRGYGRRIWQWFEDYTEPDMDALALAGEVAHGAASDDERVQRLAEWIQREFRICWADDPDSLRAAGLHPNRSLRETLRQKGGTSADANLAFAGLARGLNLQVRLLRVPSRRDWFFDQNMMNGWFLPSMQIVVQVGDSWRAYAPATRYLAWDMLPWDEEAQPALLCQRDSSRFVATPAGNPERSRVTRVGTFVLAEDGTVEGDVTLSFTGHLNEDLRTAFAGLGGSDVDSTLVREAGWSGTSLRISQVRLVAGRDERAPFAVSCHLVLPEFATVTGKHIYLEPSVLHARRSAPFTASTRRAPVYFRYPWSERDSLSLRLPEGWKAEAVEAPEPVQEPGVAAFESSLRPSEDGRSLVYLRSLRVGERGAIFFPAKEYPVVKRLFEQILERDRVAVTLSRAEAKP